MEVETDPDRGERRNGAGSAIRTRWWVQLTERRQKRRAAGQKTWRRFFQAHHARKKKGTCHGLLTHPDLMQWGRPLEPVFCKKSVLNYFFWLAKKSKFLNFRTRFSWQCIGVVPRSVVHCRGTMMLYQVICVPSPICLPLSRKSKLKFRNFSKSEKVIQERHFFPMF